MSSWNTIQFEKEKYKMKIAQGYFRNKYYFTRSFYFNK